MPRGWQAALFLVLLASASACRQPAPPPASAGPPIVILVSIDGWRWDYLERFAPAVTRRLAEAGVRAEGLIPVFPSKTFPNHYSIVTGLYPAKHGILSNNMVDPSLPGRFTLNNRQVQQDTRWWGGEPLWVTVERQGLTAATMFWPGSDVEIAGDRPTYWRTFDDGVSNFNRVDQLTAWLDRPEPARPRFLTLYFSSVDSAGHDEGPDAEETKDEVLEIDQAIARLVTAVDKQGLAGRVNYLLVSDHGMAALSPDRVIVLNDYLDMSTVDMIDSAPVVGLNPRKGTSADTVYRVLKDRHPALQVYRRESLPEHFRLRGHPRLPAVIAIADDGWHPTTRLTKTLRLGTVPGGNHGYEPRHRSMHGLFVASGPQFKNGLIVPAFENIHIYEMVCRLLAVQCASNDGDPAVTAPFLR